MIETAECLEQFIAPFPYFGGKRSVAPQIWQRFGDTKNYCEPFCGSCAVLLARSPWGGNRIETVNDANGFLANFWRAVRDDPEAVAHWADWPVSEADLHARHDYLMNTGKMQVERMKSDPDWYDAKLAGWWVWGACCWIGAGWCDEKAIRKNGTMWDARPHLGNVGAGVNRMQFKRPELQQGGRGINRMKQARPTIRTQGLGAESRESDLPGYFAALSERLRRVRICCGDWERICGPTPTTKLGLTAVFLDPPYSAEAGRCEQTYAVEDLTVAHRVRDWALEHGDDPLLRISLCGYDTEHEMPDSWECLAWKGPGGYASSGKTATAGKENRRRERIWFSPHCLKPMQGRLF